MNDPLKKRKKRTGLNLGLDMSDVDNMQNTPPPPPLQQPASPRFGGTPQSRLEGVRPIQYTPQAVDMSAYMAKMPNVIEVPQLGGQNTMGGFGGMQQQAPLGGGTRPLFGGNNDLISDTQGEASFLEELENEELAGKGELEDAEGEGIPLPEDEGEEDGDIPLPDDMVQEGTPPPPIENLVGDKQEQLQSGSGSWLNNPLAIGAGLVAGGLGLGAAGSKAIGGANKFAGAIPTGHKINRQVQQIGRSAAGNDAASLAASRRGQNLQNVNNLIAEDSRVGQKAGDFGAAVRGAESDAFLGERAARGQERADFLDTAVPDPLVKPKAKPKAKATKAKPKATETKAAETPAKSADPLSKPKGAKGRMSLEELEKKLPEYKDITMVRKELGSPPPGYRYTKTKGDDGKSSIKVVKIVKGD